MQILIRCLRRFGSASFEPVADDQDMKVAVVGATSGLGGALAQGLRASSLAYSEDLPPDCDGVVLIVGADPAPAPGSLVSTTASGWREQCDEVLQTTMEALQHARDAVLDRAGRVVVITPTVGLSGSAALVPYTTATEGVRAMAKSAARQWGRDGVRLNLVAVPLRLVAPEAAGMASHLTPAAVRDDDALLPTVISSVRFLLSTDAPALAGATIVADGGSVMVP
jgi:3-oxoacyl-[acyl-carrier protein] reductase